MTAHITLNSKKYMLAHPISNSYQRAYYNPMAAQVGQGGEYDDLQEWSAWLMDNWQAGAGQKDAKAGGFKYAESDTRFKNQIILNAWPRITHRVSRNELNSRQRASTDIVVDGTTIQSIGVYCANTNTGDVDKIWFYAEGAVGTVITVAVYTNSGGSPGTLSGSTTVTITETIPGGQWVMADLATTITPGGVFWLVVSASASITLTGIATEGVAKTYNGSSWATWTEDGNGTTWAEVYDSSETSIYSIATDKAGVWCAGSGTSGKIFRSTDNGVTWTEVYDSANTHISSIATDEAGVWCAVTYDSNKVYRSSDDGVTWTHAATLGGSHGYYGVATDKAGVWCAVGHYSSGNAHIARSTDDGVTWAVIVFGPPYIYASIATDEAGVWCAGRNAYNGNIFRSSDNGATWAEVYDSSEFSISCMATDRAGVWCAGSGAGGKIFRSTNAGVTWTEIYDSDTTTIYGMATDGAGTWVATSDPEGKIFRSSDNGATWAEVYDSSEATIYAVATDENGIWCTGTGTGGKILRSGGAIEFQKFFDTDGIAVSSDTWRLRSFNGVMYALNYGTVWEWDDTDNRWESTGAIGANSVQDAAVYDNVLYIGLGANGQAKMATAETFTTQGTTYANLYLVWRGYLWRAYQNDVYYTADGTTWTGPLEVGPDDFTIRGMAGLGDSVYVSTDDGLWVVLPGDFVEGVTPWGIPTTTNGRGMIHHQGDLYIPVGRDLLRWTADGQILNMGLNNVDGLPSDRQGRVISLVSLNNWLVAGIEPTTSISSGKASVWAWNRDGWHHILSLPVGTTIRHMAFERDTNNLWVACKDDSFCYPVRVILPNDTNNPAYDNNSTIRFQPYGWMETDWFYGGLREIYKDFESVFISGEQMSNGWCKVYWQDEDSTAWEYLGQITTDDQELRWSTANTRPNSRKVKIGLLLYGSSSNATPILDAVRVKFHPMYTDLLRWSLSIRVEDAIEWLDHTIDPRSSATILSDLDTVARSIPPVTYVDIDGTSYTVKAESGSLVPIRLEYNNSTQDFDSVYRIGLRQVVAN